MNICITSELSERRPDGSHLPFADTVKRMLEVGFRETDLSFSAKNILAPTWQAEYAEMKKLLTENGIRVRFTHLPYDYPKAETEENHRAFFDASVIAMDCACELGADCATIHPHTFMTRDYDAAHIHDETIAFLRPYAEAAKARGLALALEIMRGAGKSADPAIKRYCTNVDDLIRCADELGTGICWDTGHANISAQAQEESLRKIGNRLLEVHINDNFAEDDVHIPPFTGKVDWEGVIRGLRAIGYRNSINLEVNANRIPENARETYIRYLYSAATELARRVGEEET